MIFQNEKKLVRDVISEETSKEVRRALESVVANGTGRNAYIEGHSVGGKTGTAQKVNNGVYMIGNYIVSFIGFTPADNPEVIVYVAIDYPKGITQYGGTVAAPLAKAILEDCISILNIEKDENVKDKEYNYLDDKYYTVPNVIGLEKKEAIKLLNNFSIIYSGSGNVIKDQTPQAGERLKEGEKIKLLLG